MTFDDLAERSACWFNGSGFQSTLVVSSRVRLARNLHAVPFVRRASETDLREVMEAVVAACRGLRSAGEMTFFEVSGLSELQRQLLVERHLISPALAKGRGLRGVLVDPAEALSVLVNEEDHLRIQAIVSGFQAYDAWRAAAELERELTSGLDYAFSEKWGYLTACPTNTGTGLRASILIHLPG
ncbi:MAG TPA: ATP--guanido phosphotransferase, partial [Candidatus Glassbacteria bacterium]|nr:ATP--guanido phosphotransferase [Candidatus Glassbacteria bacterium]